MSSSLVMTRMAINRYRLGEIREDVGVRSGHLTHETTCVVDES